MNTKLNQATLLLTSAYKSLLNPTRGYKQTYPLPLAMEWMKVGSRRPRFALDDRSALVLRFRMGNAPPICYIRGSVFDG